MYEYVQLGIFNEKGPPILSTYCIWSIGIVYAIDIILILIWWVGLTSKVQLGILCKDKWIFT